MTQYKHFMVADMQTDCPLEWFVALLHQLDNDYSSFWQSYPCNHGTLLASCDECPFFEEHRIEL